MAPAVRAGGAPLRQAPPLQPVQKAHEPGALDAERLGELGLRQAGIGADDDNDRELRRAEVEAREPADEVLKYPDLQPPHEIAEAVVERAEIGRGVRPRPAHAACLPCHERRLAFKRLSS